MSGLLRIYPGDASMVLVANVLVQVTVVILAAQILAHLGRSFNAARRHSIYVVALICVLASPLMSVLLQAGGIALVTLRPPARPAPPAAPLLLPVARVPQSGLIREPAVRGSAAAPERRDVASHALESNTAPASAPSELLRMLGGGTLVIWLLGSALLLARLCHGLRVVAALRRRARPLDGEVIEDVLGKVRRALGADRLPPIAVSTDMDRPVMVGLVRPTVILPESLLRTHSGPKLVDILVHECAHAVCRHYVVGFLQRMAAVLFWPHPLVHLLNRELARAREELCDNYVLRLGDAPRYARTLLELSQLLVGVSPKPAVLGLFHCRWRLEDRIAGLLDRRRNKMIRVSHWTTAAWAAVFLALSLLVASTRVLQAEPGPAEKSVPTAAPSGLPAQPTPRRDDPLTQDGDLRQSAQHLREIMSAIHTYHGVAGHFPMPKSGWGYDPKTKEWFRQRPYLSWRVLLLPLLGEKELFEKFHLGQPWDSEHNRKLVAQMPKIYRAPGSNAGDGKTNYLGAFGPNAAFPDKGTVTIVDFEDGTSNTIMLLEVPDQAAVEWTRPEDFPADAPESVKKLVGLRKGGFLTAFADGAPHLISDNIPTKTLRQLLVRNDREPITPFDWQGRWDHFVQPAVKPSVTVEFRRAEQQPGERLTAASVAGTTQKVYLHGAADATNVDIAEARAAVDSQQKPVVEITFTEEGAKKMAKLTAECQGQPLAILIDGQVVCAPVVKSTLSRVAQITGIFTQEEVDGIVRGINGRGKVPE